MKLRALRALLLAVVALLLVAPGTYAQLIVGHSGWEWGNPLPQGNTIRALDFLGTSGYAAGDYGTVLASDDGGSTWRALVTGSTADFEFLQLTGPGSLVVAGECTVIRSDDSGATFRRVAWDGSGSRCRLPVAGISFPSAKTGYVLRADGTLFRATDGGKSWEELAGLSEFAADEEQRFATGVAFADAEVGLVTTRDGIYRTGDGGSSWSFVANAPLTGLHGVWIGDRRAYALGTGMVLESEDAGRSWSARPLDSASHAIRLGSIRCTGTDACLVTTAAGDRIYRSIDGGDSFAQQPAPAPGTLAVAFTDGGAAVAGGTGGATAVSPDSGLHWSRLDSAITGRFSRLKGDSEGLAFAIGPQGAFARSGDGGFTWAEIPAPTKADLVDVSFVDSRTGFLLDGNGTLFRTDDGAAAWRELLVDGENAAQGLLALDGDRVLLVGARGIRRSADGGETFVAVRRRAVRHAFLFGLDYAGGSLFAYGPTSLFGSRDGGRSWRRLGRPDHRPLAIVDFVGANVGYALGKGGRIWRTRKRGRSWSEIRAAGTDGGIDLAAVSAREAYVASNDLFFAAGANRPDYVLRTSDGGGSWRPQLVTNSRSFAGVLATRPSRAILLASGNQLLTTASGGNRGGRSYITIRAKRRLDRPGRVRITGRLRPADRGERVIVSRTAADPRQRRGSVDWDFKSARVASNGSFRTTWSVRQASVFVAQWTGNGYLRGSGSRAVTVRVRGRR